MADAEENECLRKRIQEKVGDDEGRHQSWTRKMFLQKELLRLSHRHGVTSKPSKTYVYERRSSPLLVLLLAVGGYGHLWTTPTGLLIFKERPSSVSSASVR